MKRRFAVVAFILVGWLCFVQQADAQNQPAAKVGILWHLSAAEMAPYQKGVADAMQGLGWIDGKNIQYLVRYMEGDPTRVPQIIKEFVVMKVDVIYLPDQAIKPAREVTKTIPMVTGDFYDPILEGFTTSLAKPSQNVTGVSWQSIESAGKRVELAKELVTGLKNIAFLYDSTELGAMIEQKGIVSAARFAKVGLRNYPVQDLGSLRAALAPRCSDCLGQSVVVEFSRRNRSICVCYSGACYRRSNRVCIGWFRAYQRSESAKCFHPRSLLFEQDSSRRETQRSSYRAADKI